MEEFWGQKERLEWAGIKANQNSTWPYKKSKKKKSVERVELVFTFLT